MGTILSGRWTQIGPGGRWCQIGKYFMDSNIGKHPCGRKSCCGCEDSGIEVEVGNNAYKERHFWD